MFVHAVRRAQEGVWLPCRRSSVGGQQVGVPPVHSCRLRGCRSGGPLGPRSPVGRRRGRHRRLARRRRRRARPRSGYRPPPPPIATQSGVVPTLHALVFIRLLPSCHFSIAALQRRLAVPLRKITHSDTHRQAAVCLASVATAIVSVPRLRKERRTVPRSPTRHAEAA